MSPFSDFVASDPGHVRKRCQASGSLSAKPQINGPAAADFEVETAGDADEEMLHADLTMLSPTKSAGERPDTLSKIARRSSSGSVGGDSGTAAGSQAAGDDEQFDDRSDDESDDGAGRSKFIFTPVCVEHNLLV